MNKTLSTLLIAAFAAVVTVSAPLPASADGRDEALEADKGVNPDQTTRQRYQAAVDDANAKLKSNLAQCEKMQPGERAECVREARDLHDADIAQAGDVLHRPR